MVFIIIVFKLYGKVHLSSRRFPTPVIRLILYRKELRFLQGSCYHVLTLLVFQYQLKKQQTQLNYI